MCGPNSKAPDMKQVTTEKKAEPVFTTATITETTTLPREAAPVPVPEQPAQLIQTTEQRQENQRLQALTESLLLQQKAKHPLTFQPPAKYSLPQDDSYKARKEREKQLKAGKKLTDGADIYTARLLHAVKNEEQLRWNSMPSEATMATYRTLALASGIDARQLSLMMKPVHMNAKNEPISEKDQYNHNRNRQFLKDYSSGEIERITPYLDEVIDEINSFRFSPDMMEAEYFTDHAEEIIHMSKQLTLLSDLRKQFPEYFAALPQLKKDLLEDVDFITPMFSDSVTKTLQIHAINTFQTEDRTISKADRDRYAETYDITINLFQADCAQLDARRTATLQREADRQAPQKLLDEDRAQLSVTPIGQGAYRYGMPSAEDLRSILENQPNLSAADMQVLLNDNGILHLMELSRAYHKRLNNIGQAGKENSDGADLHRLMTGHSRFVTDAATLARRYAASNDPSLQAAAAALGFMAMKTGSYSAMIANLESEFIYTTTLNGKETLHTLMTRDNLASEYEGSRPAERYQENLQAKEAFTMPRLDSTLREKAAKLDYSSDRNFSAIVMTCEAYEEFLRNTQIPPCGTPEEQELYPQRIEQLSKNLLAFKDRIAARTLCYLDKKSQRGSEQELNLCRVLEETLLYNDSFEQLFSNAAQLAYNLRHNNFSDPEFNRKYTGVMLTDALKNTHMEALKLNHKEFKATKGGMSKVYIPKAGTGGQYVFRNGQYYRGILNPNGASQDLDHTKGGIRMVHITKGAVIDSHKPGRDMAVHRVDQLLGANVIASAEQVMFAVKDSVSLGTKMKNAPGKMASKYQFSFGPDTDTVNLTDPQSMSKLYWLQTVDAICGSADRHGENFFLESNERGQISSITGIDNDMSFGHEFVPMVNAEARVDFSRKRRNPYLLYTPIYENAFPCVPAEIKDKLQGMSAADLEKQLRGIIRDDELLMTIRRFEALKAHFEKIPAFDLKNEEDARLCAQATEKKARALLATEERSQYYSNYFAMLGTLEKKSKWGGKK